jgi:hypothetical protein
MPEGRTYSIRCAPTAPQGDLLGQIDYAGSMGAQQMRHNKLASTDYGPIAVSEDTCCLYEIGTRPDLAQP